MTPETAKGPKLFVLEQEIERIVAEIGRVIKGANPEDRAELRDFAHAMINQEVDVVIDERREVRHDPYGSFNPFGLGLLLVFVGGGLMFLFGLVGALVAAIGLVATLSGLAQVLLRKR